MTDREPVCSICKKGLLVPVNLGRSTDRSVKYRCTNNECNARFDEHGYELYNPEKHEWEKQARG